VIVVAEQQKKRTNYAWPVFQFRDMPATLIGIAHDQPDHAPKEWTAEPRPPK
jgi:hypothetical protein